MKRAKSAEMLAVLTIFLSCVVSCGGGGGEEQAPSSDTIGSTGGSSSGSSGDGGAGSSTTTVSAFPLNVIVASPTSISNTIPITTSSQYRAASANGYISDYQVGTAAIEDLLASLTDAEDEVDFDLLFDVSNDAACYGPYLPFENHPDAPSSSSDDVRDGELPTGDLGLWTVTEGGTDEACAAAELNARLDNINDRNNVALLSLASLVAAYEGEGNTWPDDVTAGSSVNLFTEMNAMGMLNTTFTAATMALNTAGTQWTYHLDITYTLNLVDYEIVLNLEHIPGTTAGTYEGLLTFLVNDTFTGGNCGEGENDVTLNGSLHYNQASATNVTLQYRETQFCDHDVNGIQSPVDSTSLSGNIVSASPTESFSDTWENNFTIFTAEFDPSTLGGSYSFAWQAGYNDSHSRVLNVGLEATTSGEAYFGFGSRIQDVEFDGGAKGFICNWAGPGNDHTLQPYVQRQHITLDTDQGIYTPTYHSEESNDSSDIIYAPTNSCLYDRMEDGGFVFGSERFEYDRDLDLTIDEDDIGDVLETVTDSTSQLEFGLRGIPSSSTSATIWEYLTEDRGYDLPDYP